MKVLYSFIFVITVFFSFGAVSARAEDPDCNEKCRNYGACIGNDDTFFYDRTWCSENCSDISLSCCTAGRPLIRQIASLQYPQFQGKPGWEVAFCKLNVPATCPASCRLTDQIDQGTCVEPEFGKGIRIPKSCIDSCSPQDAEAYKQNFIACCDGSAPTVQGAYGGDLVAYCASSEVKVEPKPPLTFQPNITIPGSEFVMGKKISVDGSLLGKYVTALFNFFIGALSVLAAVFLIYGGYIWITAAGNATRVSRAREIIFGSFIGLFLGLGSYMLLNFINPELVVFKFLNIPEVVGLDLQVLGDTADSGPPGCSPLETLTGQEARDAAVRKAVSLTQENVSYRFGAKTGLPCSKDPSVEFCLDCSGLVSYAYYCGANYLPPPGTMNLFSSALKTVSCTTDQLIPGDLIGFPPEKSWNGKGHVVIYVGDGQVVEAAGGTADGNAVFVSSLQDRIDGFRSRGAEVICKRVEP